MPVAGQGEEQQVTSGVAVFAFDAPQSERESLAVGDWGPFDCCAAGQESKGNVLPFHPGARLSGGESAWRRQGKAIGIEQDHVFADGAVRRAKIA